MFDLVRSVSERPSGSSPAGSVGGIRPTGHRRRILRRALRCDLSVDCAVDGQRDQLRRIKHAADKAGAEITIVLDLVHVLEYLWRAAPSFYPEGADGAESRIECRGRPAVARVSHQRRLRGLRQLTGNFTGSRSTSGPTHHATPRASSQAAATLATTSQAGQVVETSPVGSDQEALHPSHLETIVQRS